ncbi:MAG: TMEM175 family protein [Actinomycetota bacterium]|nr:TMEM175 family protein [Actinomycetota bacterium]
METGRLETFADGVFAIAITLLVLEIPHPEVDENLGRELVGQWHAYLAYVLSFAIIGIVWVNHHVILRQFSRTDRAFLFINVFFLMCVAFIPFPTALISDDLGSETAMVSYGATLTVTAAFFNVLWHYGRLRLLRPDADRREVTGITRSYIPGVLVYGAATLLALVSPEASFIVFASLAVVYVVSGSVWGPRDTG